MEENSEEGEVEEGTTEEMLKCCVENKHPRAERDVQLSIRRLLRRSTTNPKWDRKSAPRMGWDTSAMVNIQRRDRRRPKSKVKLFSPYVAMAEPLAAYKEEPRKEVEEVEEE